MADFIKDGGPAFPGEKDVVYVDSLGYEKGTKRAIVAGMTLRDYFAGKELAKVDGVSVNDIPSAYLRLADHCYRMADAMLIAREQPQPSNGDREGGAV